MYKKGGSLLVMSESRSYLVPDSYYRMQSHEYHMQYTCEQPTHDKVVVLSTTELFLMSNTHPAFVVVVFFSLQHPPFPGSHRFIVGFLFCCNRSDGHKG